ncbi:sugar ABC transporter permease [Kitasatospora indigofera]|uniref:Sugar ABC transporter permease n=1 Tax=Kitasatospora indigofera TaxID=67307 RepID=A0A918YVQ4_9ACTN|nr:carbohydrate ABC transporter permease [Kitasatospora indigofera]GHE26314.1 sugar ABC transporter permease [Kitasatospora indigofera]
MTDHPRPRVRAHLRPGRIAGHGVLALGVLVFAFPFYWLLVIATNSTSDILAGPPRLLPGTHFLDNFEKVTAGSEFVRAFANSVVLTAGSSALQLLLAALAGYVFAKRRFPGRGALFSALLVTLIIPTGVSIVPSYQIYSGLGWTNTFLPLVVPNAVTAFGVFWMRQAAEANVPDELVDAARMDGAGFLRTFWSVALPCMRPALVAFGIFQVMWTWNDYLWPLLVLNRPENFTLPVALQQLTGSYGPTDYSVVMAGTLVATLPLLVLFLILRRTVLLNASDGALKG